MKEIIEKLRMLAEEADSKKLFSVAGTLYAFLGALHGGPESFARFVAVVGKHNHKHLDNCLPHCLQSFSQL